MNTDVKKKSNFREIIKFISTIISWTIFVLLLICACLLIYYFIAIRVYIAKGEGHEPAFSLYTIISPSMTPNINTYDVVVDTKVKKPEDIKINDVITFNSSIPGVRGGTITHRVIAINIDTNGEYHYRTKGDYNLVDDGVDVEFDDIVGKVSLRIPQLGKLQSFMATKTGWLILVLIPALYIIFKDVIKIIKLKNSEANNKFSRFLNRPLLTFKKRKLLTYTPQEETLEKNIEPTINPIEKEEKIINFYEDEETDDFDLPPLK